MAAIDSLKAALAALDANSPILIQLGTGSTIELSASDLQTALGIHPVTPVVPVPPAHPVPPVPTVPPPSQPVPPMPPSAGIKHVRVTSTFLRIRAQPTVNSPEVARMPENTVFDVIDTTPVKADNFSWLRTADMRGWVAIDYTVPADGPVAPPPTTTVPPVTTTPPTSATFALPFSANQRGVGTSAGGWTPSALELDLVRRNNVQFALIACYEPGQAVSAIPALRNAGVKAFVLRAAIHEAVSSPQRYIELSTPILHEYANAIGNSQPLMIAVHNEPNVTPEGWSRAWNDGSTFAQWFLTVAAAYRQSFPGVKIGFPALSPGSDVANLRMSDNAFITGAGAAIQASDWAGVHDYWVNADGSDLATPIAQWRSWYGNLPLVGTEVGPGDQTTTSAQAVRNAYQKFAQVGVPACIWVLDGAGAWQTAAWDLHNLTL